MLQLKKQVNIIKSHIRCTEVHANSEFWARLWYRYVFFIFNQIGYCAQWNTSSSTTKNWNVELDWPTYKLPVIYILSFFQILARTMKHYRMNCWRWFHWKWQEIQHIYVVDQHSGSTQPTLISSLVEMGTINIFFHLMHHIRNQSVVKNLVGA